MSQTPEDYTSALVSFRLTTLGMHQGRSTGVNTKGDTS